MKNLIALVVLFAFASMANAAVQINAMNTNTASGYPAVGTVPVKAAGGWVFMPTNGFGSGGSNGLPTFSTQFASQGGSTNVAKGIAITNIIIRNEAGKNDSGLRVDQQGVIGPGGDIFQVSSGNSPIFGVDTNLNVYAATGAHFNGSGSLLSNLNGGVLFGNVLNTTNGKVGIGTTAPSHTLHIVTATNNAVGIDSTGTDSASMLHIHNYAGTQGPFFDFGSPPGEWGLGMSSLGAFLMRFTQNTNTDPVNGSTLFTYSTNGDLTISGVYTGNASGLTNLNPSTAFGSGTIPSANLPSTYASNIVSGGQLPIGTVATNTGTDGQLLSKTGDSRKWVDAPAGGGGVPNFLTNNVTLSYAADGSNIWINAASAKIYNLILTANTVFNAPTNAQVDGQSLILRLTQDATGSRTFATNAATNNIVYTWKFGTDITGITLSTAANTTDLVTCLWNAASNRWCVAGFVRGY